MTNLVELWGVEKTTNCVLKLFEEIKSKDFKKEQREISGEYYEWDKWLEPLPFPTKKESDKLSIKLHYENALALLDYIESEEFKEQNVPLIL